MSACKEPPGPFDEIERDSYENFRLCLLPCLLQEWHSPAARFLDSWVTAHGFLSTASWTKKLLLELRHRATMASRLVRLFGSTFRGDQVGAPGRDIIEYALKRPALVMREAAVQVLESWLEDDEDGTWLSLLSNHISFEQDPRIRAQCQELVQHLAGELEDEEDDDEDDDILGLLEEFLEVNRRLPNLARAQLETRTLPDFLEKVADVDQSLTLAALESVNIGRLVAEDSRYGFHLSQVGGGWLFRGWRVDGSSSFSIEPTANGSWLVFTRF